MVLLILVVFFYHQDPQVITLNAPSLDFCKSHSASVVEAVEAKPEVRSASAECFVEGDKV